jgi:hypothetical protein
MQEIAQLLHVAQEHLAFATSSAKNAVAPESSTWVLGLNRVARLVGAGRVTTCKDGMDLTSMSATLEFAHLLRDNHQIQHVEDTADTLRMRGVRRANVHKNTYQRNYATVFREKLAQPYKPPRGTSS